MHILIWTEGDRKSNHRNIQKATEIIDTRNHLVTREVTRVGDDTQKSVFALVRFFFKKHGISQITYSELHTSSNQKCTALQQYQALRCYITEKHPRIGDIRPQLTSALRDTAIV